MLQIHSTSVLVVVFIAACADSSAFRHETLAEDKPPLELVGKISLNGPSGRLDHLTLDAKGSRLFVANMANNSLDVVDLKGGKLVRQISDQKGIQGVAYAADLDRVFVGNGAGDSCNVFDGRDYKLLKSFELPDTDNVRYDSRTQRVYAAHAEKALAVIDAKSLELHGDIKLPGSPEAFQLEKARPILYLNAPSANMVVAIDLQKDEVVRRWPLKLAGANYPLTIDQAAHRVFAGCRKPPAIVVLDSESGKEICSVSIPGDLDDLFFDAKRRRLYASCGEGFIAVIRQIDADRYEPVAKVVTKKGARTSLFDPDSGRLYLVVPRHEGEATGGPEIWIYRTDD